MNKKGAVDTVIKLVLLVVVLVIILISLVFGLIPSSYQEALDTVKEIGNFFDKFLEIISGKDDGLLGQQQEEFVEKFDNFVNAYEKCFTSSKKDCICPSELDKSKFKESDELDNFAIKIEKIGEEVYFQPIQDKKEGNFLVTDARILNVGRQYICVYDFKNDHLEIIDEMEVVFEKGDIKVKALNKNFFIEDWILYKDNLKNVCFVKDIEPVFSLVASDKLSTKTYC